MFTNVLKYEEPCDLAKKKLETGWHTTICGMCLYLLPITWGLNFVWFLIWMFNNKIFSIKGDGLGLAPISAGRIKRPEHEKKMKKQIINHHTYLHHQNGCC